MAITWFPIPQGRGGSLKPFSAVIWERVRETIFCLQWREIPAVARRTLAAGVAGAIGPRVREERRAPPESWCWRNRVDAPAARLSPRAECRTAGTAGPTSDTETALRTPPPPTSARPPAPPRPAPPPPPRGAGEDRALSRVRPRALGARACAISFPVVAHRHLSFMLPVLKRPCALFGIASNALVHSSQSLRRTSHRRPRPCHTHAPATHTPLPHTPLPHTPPPHTPAATHAPTAMSHSHGYSRVECSADLLTMASESTGSHEPAVGGSFGGSRLWNHSFGPIIVPRPCALTYTDVSSIALRICRLDPSGRRRPPLRYKRGRGPS